MRSLAFWLLLLWGLTWLFGGLGGGDGDEWQDRRPRQERPGQDYVESHPRRGQVLPPPAMDDPEVMVQPEARRGSSVGTAFAVHESGVWLTARHVVHGCSEVGMRGRFGWSRVQVEWLHPRADMAIVRTAGAPTHLAFSANDVHLEQTGYAFGFPQARPGAVYGHLLGRTRMRSPGLFTGSSMTLAWAEGGRGPEFEGSLGGISGGPLLDDQGRVIGVIVAEVPRRGRFETLAPEVIRAVATRSNMLPAPAEPALSFAVEPRNFGRVGDELRRQMSVALIGCKTS